MQGEGQEFESPRLHHISAGHGDGPAEPATTLNIRHRSPVACRKPEIISSLASRRLETTDQRIAGVSGVSLRLVHATRNAPFQVKMTIGRSSLFLNFDFCRMNKVMIPIHLKHPPSGELLKGVKLHRARGGCLGAKSR